LVWESQGRNRFFCARESKGCGRRRREGSLIWAPQKGRDRFSGRDRIHSKGCARVIRRIALELTSSVWGVVRHARLARGLGSPAWNPPQKGPLPFHILTDFSAMRYSAAKIILTSRRPLSIVGFSTEREGGGYRRPQRPGGVRQAFGVASVAVSLSCPHKHFPSLFQR
jgi:hypothetical protein